MALPLPHLGSRALALGLEFVLPSRLSIPEHRREGEANEGNIESEPDRGREILVDRISSPPGEEPPDQAEDAEEDAGLLVLRVQHVLPPLVTGGASSRVVEA